MKRVINNRTKIQNYFSTSTENQGSSPMQISVVGTLKVPPGILFFFWYHPLQKMSDWMLSTSSRNEGQILWFTSFFFICSIIATCFIASSCFCISWFSCIIFFSFWWSVDRWFSTFFDKQRFYTKRQVQVKSWGFTSVVWMLIYL